jgi:hypothetical protein
VSNNIQGAIKGRPGRGLVTIRTDGSILLENVTITGVRFKGCDIHAEPGEKPIPAADRLNSVENYISGDREMLWVGGLKERS